MNDEMSREELLREKMELEWHDDHEDDYSDFSRFDYFSDGEV